MQSNPTESPNTMTKQEYQALLIDITARKVDIEAEDTKLEKAINDCLDTLKGGASQTAQAEMDRYKYRRFTELLQKRGELCEGYIREITGFKGNMLQIYTIAEDRGLKGKSWARFMLESCGCPEPR
jgi:hypothetical protein